MKTMKKFLSMAALAMVGAMMTGCSSEDNVIDQAQTATKNNVVTQTVTVGFDEQAATRALAIDYTNKKLTKTFKADDQIAVIYQNTSNELVKETVTIAAGDISTDGKSATFTVTMTNPKASGTLKYIYPAAMAGATDVDYNKLNSQDGTLASLASNLDLATFEGTLTAASELPASAKLENKLAILALTIKNSEGTSDLTSTITGMNIIAGTNSYTITGKDADVHIYAAIQATSGANISYFATDGTKNYTKAVTGKTYVANNIYNLGLKMDDATTVSPADFTTDQTIGNGSTLSGYQSNNVKISIADGAIVTLKDVTINGISWTTGDYAGITCEGSATIILEGENTVKGFNASYPGIYVPEGKTLTIMGSGSLNASSNGSGAGIGGCENGTCGNIVIKGGEITATGGANGGAGIGGASNGTCGNITISGGTITATGGNNAAGIGGSFEGTCGNITISGGTVTATGGYGGAGIGGGVENYACGTITITSGTVTAAGGDFAAGIGGGEENYACGTITITSGVTSVTATKGNYAPYSIGKGVDAEEDITVNIDGVANATTSSEFPNFTSSVSGNTWTLTHK